MSATPGPPGSPAHGPGTTPDPNAGPFETLDLGAPTVGGVGLCLSGGGYRAMVFHLGALRRLNEAGWLPKLTRVASVSGGSIIAGVLGLGWRDLDFDGDGVARRFGDLVEEPILRLAGTTVDVPAVLNGLVSGGASRRVQASYDRYLFHGATLQDLPADDEGPRFILLATNLSNGTLWRFSRPYMRDWRSEPVYNPTLPLAHAVAASSAFPPVLSPCRLRIPGRDVVTLTDGGVFDNLGLEPVLKRCATLFVSDGGGTFKEQPKPPGDWLRGTLRVLSTVDVQVRRLRRRQLMDALESGQRAGSFWAVNSLQAEYGGRSPNLPCPEEESRALAATPTRLAAMSPETRHRLVNWGYGLADAALRTFVDPALPEPAGFPHPGGIG